MLCVCHSENGAVLLSSEHEGHQGKWVCVFSLSGCECCFTETEGKERAKLLVSKLNNVLLDFCGFIKLAPQEKPHQS